MGYPWATNALLTAADLNAAFALVLGKRSWSAQTSGSDQSGISAVTDVTGLSVTWTADPLRMYKTTVNVCLQKITTANNVTTYIRNAGGTVVVAKSTTFAINDLAVVTMEWVESGLSGSQTRKASVETASGTVTVTNSFSRNGQIIVEDIGPLV